MWHGIDVQVVVCQLAVTCAAISRFYSVFRKRGATDVDRIHVVAFDVPVRARP